MRRRLLILLVVSMFYAKPVLATQAVPQTETEETIDTENVSEKNSEEPELIYAPPEEKQKVDVGMEIQDGEINTTGEATIQKGNGYISMRAYCAASINETIYVKFMDLSSYKYYAYYLYPLNDFKTCMEVPAGNYIIVDGGPLYDTTNLYPVEEKSFQVQPNGATYVEFGVGMEPNRAGVYEEETEEIKINLESVEVDEETGEETLVTEENVTKIGKTEEIVENIESIDSEPKSDVVVPKYRKSRILSLLITIGGLFLIFGIILFILKKHKEED